MSQTRSGYVVEVPLGLWTALRFEFETSDDLTKVEHVEALLAGGDEVGVVPEELGVLVNEYYKTWLLSPSEDWFATPSPVGWADESWWHEATILRLKALAADGDAFWTEDLDD